MIKPELTKEESELYLAIVKGGSMDTMFDFGIAIGLKMAREELHKINIFSQR